jgi:hypothetical protein
VEVQNKNKNKENEIKLICVNAKQHASCQSSGYLKEQRGAFCLQLFDQNIFRII